MTSEHRPDPLPSSQAGRHRVEVDGNVLRIWLRGTFDEADARRFYDLLEETRAACGSVYAVSDMREAGPPAPEARRHIVQRFRQGIRIDGWAFINANLMVRTMITLMTNAVRIFTGSFNLPMTFVHSDAEALAWLSTQRPGPQPASASKPAPR